LENGRWIGASIKIWINKWQCPHPMKFRHLKEF
jgi:hypothetical protein